MVCVYVKYLCLPELTFSYSGLKKINSTHFVVLLGFTKEDKRHRARKMHKVLKVWYLDKHID